MNSCGALFPVPAVAENQSIADTDGEVPKSQRPQQSNGRSSSNPAIENHFTTLHVTNQGSSIVIDHHRQQEGLCGSEPMADDGKNAIIPSPTELKRQSAVFVDPRKLLTESKESYAQVLVSLAVEGEEQGFYPFNVSAVAPISGRHFNTTRDTTPLAAPVIPLKRSSAHTHLAVASPGSSSSSTEFGDSSVLTDDGAGSLVAMKAKTSGSSMNAKSPFTLPWNTASSGFGIPSEITIPEGRNSAPPFFAVKDTTDMNGVSGEKRVSWPDNQSQ
jgi:hypothetical protein